MCLYEKPVVQLYPEVFVYPETNLQISTCDLFPSQCSPLETHTYKQPSFFFFLNIDELKKVTCKDEVEISDL